MKVVRWTLLLALGGTGLVFIIFAMLGKAGVLGLAADEATLFSTIFAFTGTLQLLLGVGFFYGMTRQRNRRQDLLSYGQRVRAEVTELRVNRSVDINGKRPKNVFARCIHPVTQQEVTLKSHMLWHPPVDVGGTVEIAFDPMNERRYAFDLPEE